MFRIKPYRAPIWSILPWAGCLLLSLAAYAQNADSSMDSVWSDHEKGGRDSAKPVSTGDSGDAQKHDDALGADTTPPLTGSAEPAQAPAESPKGQSEAAASPDERPRGRGEGGRTRNKRVAAAAPLCTVDTFARSALVSSGLWPGVGPFKVAEDGGNQLIDEARNTIKLKANAQKKVTGVEMQLSGGKSGRDFLGLEMTCDFLLEALGTRPARIADFNTQLEKLKGKIAGKAASEQNLTAARYLVYIKPTGKTGFNISVNNGEASADAIKDHDSGGANLAATEEDSSQDTTGETMKRLRAMLNRPTPPADATRSGDTAKPRKPELASASTGTVTSDSLRDTFHDLIQNWQQIKKAAVKSRDTSELAKVLSGKALLTQTNGVKWLSAHKRYYDMQPMGVEITSCTEVGKGKYSVRAKVKELSKMYDETDNKLLRSQRDTYEVDYKVEKLDERFVIVDSTIVKYTPSDSTGG